MRKVYLFGIVFAFLFSIVSPAQKIVYVKPVASGIGDGSSWANASPNLKALLDAASTTTQIWVAAGTYKPTTGTDRSASFVMKNNVALYGGFAGNETQVSQRNPALNICILSGNIGNLNDSSDNSYHVIANDNNFIGSSAVIDGFTIRDGNANASPNNLGGGMYNNNSAPSIINCIFTGNYADNGGGLYNISASPIINNCIFSGNLAKLGGGVYNSASGPALTNCVFLGNAATQGGGLYNTGSPARLVNCSLSGNNASSFGGAMFNVFASSVSVVNCIAWGNNSGILSSSSSTSISYSIVAGVIGGFKNLDADPLFLSQPAIGLGVAGNLRISPCSPAVDGGQSSSNFTATDLAGDIRKFGTIDIGAYEQQSARITAWYVDSSATGTGDGRSWANAFTSLGTALAQMKNCYTSDTLAIAKGTYAAGAPFEFDKLNAIVLGGYPSGGGSSRDPQVNPVYINGTVNVRKSFKIDGVTVVQ